MRTAFTDLWKSRAFLADYSRIIKTEPILVTGEEAQKILADPARCAARSRTSWSTT